MVPSVGKCRHRPWWPRTGTPYLKAVQRASVNFTKGAKRQAAPEVGRWGRRMPALDPPRSGLVQQGVEQPGRLPILGRARSIPPTAPPIDPVRTLLGTG